MKLNWNINTLILVCPSIHLVPLPPPVSLARLCAPWGCSSSRSVTSRTRTEFCWPATAATCRPAAPTSVAQPGTSVTLTSKPASKSTRPGSTPPEPAPSARAARGSWAGTRSRSATEGTLQEEEEKEERMKLMDTLSFPSNTPGR